MQVSSNNVIRFPVMASPLTHRVEAQASIGIAEEASKLLEFAPNADDATVAQRSQDHGQLFVAHRIVGRVADQLDQIAAL